MADTYQISQAQKNLPRLCRKKQAFIIARREDPVFVALPIGDYEAIKETLDLLGNPNALAVLRAAKAGTASYRELDMGDENLGL
jgi:PHD/YefM family antitoxin component YafN of YafNO toxin-antitoxin module